MRASTAYFAGAGTVIIAIGIGGSGGFLIADMINPKFSKHGTELTRLERRTSPDPFQAAAAPSEPVQYLSAPQLSATIGTAPTQTQSQAESVNAGSEGARPLETFAATQPAATPAPPPATPMAKPGAQQQAATAEDSFARARDADAKRVAAEKRRAERRQRWTEKRRQRQQQELRLVEEIVREETEPRQEFAAEPERIEMPRIRLFSPD